MKILKSWLGLGLMFVFVLQHLFDIGQNATLVPLLIYTHINFLNLMIYFSCHGNSPTGLCSRLSRALIHHFGLLVLCLNVRNRLRRANSIFVALIKLNFGCSSWCDFSCMT